MKLAKYLLLIILVTSAVGGCAYTNIRSPLDTGLEKTELGTKCGTSSNYAVLWLFAWGDASYAKAAKNGGIKVMRHSDQELKQYFFGMFVKQSTIVYGD
jgi:hypothetical protein